MCLVTPGKAHSGAVKEQLWKLLQAQQHKQPVLIVEVLLFFFQEQLSSVGCSVITAQPILTCSDAAALRCSLLCMVLLSLRASR
jgi:hypothetical protein